MGAALEIVIIPVLLLTGIVLFTVLSDLHFGVILAGAVFLGILYAVVVGLLKLEHDEDVEAPAPGEENAQPEPLADVETARDQAGPADDPTEHRSSGA